MEDGEPLKKVIGGIPVYCFLPTNTTKIDAGIIMCHGREQTSQQYFHLANELLVKFTNIAVFVFDQRNHGERCISNIQNTSWKDGNNSHALDMYSLIYGNSNDISYLIDTIPISINITIKTWGSIGISLGGHSILMAVCHEPRLEIGISIIGCGDYLSLMTSRAKYYNVEFPSVNDQQLIDYIKEKDPVNNINGFKNKKLFFCSGGLDKLVPLEASQKFLDSLKSDICTVFVDPTAKHETSLPMRKEYLEWLSRILK